MSSIIGTERKVCPMASPSFTSRFLKKPREKSKFVVSKMASIKRKLDQQQGLVVPSVQRGGGLALLCKSSMKVDVQTYSPWHIVAIIIEEQSNKQWRFTGFYSHLETNKLEESWRLLEELRKRSDLPWICMGDFNEEFLWSDQPMQPERYRLHRVRLHLV